MPSTIHDLVESADSSYGGSVPWGAPVPERSGGIYLIALTKDTETLAGIETPPVDMASVQDLLNRRSGLTLDGQRPSPDELAERIRGMWLPDEPVVYIGKATNLAARVGQYYSTPLGARSPHAGGWPLKVLSDMDRLTVHWATTAMPELAEQKALAAFVHGVSDTSRSGLWDPQHPYPFANLEGPGGRKRHGITGARDRRTDRPQSAVPVSEPRPPSVASTERNPMVPTTGRVTLHEEIAAILRDQGDEWMTTQEIARQVVKRGHYRKRDGTSNVTPFRIHGRTKNYPQLFERDGSRVRLNDE